MIPTVISGHGNGSLVHDQGSSDTPLTPVLASCRGSPLFGLEEPKGELLGIYSLQPAARLQFPVRPTGASVDPSYQRGLAPPWTSTGIRSGVLDVFILLWGNFIAGADSSIKQSVLSFTQGGARTRTHAWEFARARAHYMHH